MTKDEISRINMQMLDGKIYGVPTLAGDPDEVLALAMIASHKIIKEIPKMRKEFALMALEIWKRTRPEWMNTAAVYALGCAVLLGAV